MSSLGVLQIALLFVGLFPLVTGARWIAGGLLFALLDKRRELTVREWPPVTVLIPAHNESAVIADCVHAALALEYPKLAVRVLDDGSTDDTVAVARAAAGGDPRFVVVEDAVNRGKASRLNIGITAASSELIVITDADTTLHPEAIKRLVTRIERSALIAAVAGAPHVTNRRHLLAALQALEAASIIGLIRRTHAVSGRVAIVAGVLGIFRRSAVDAVGGFDERMATEDIDLTWRLIRAGWDTDYEPRALVGMEVPTTLRALWAQRCRWARGQGEVLRKHARSLWRWRNRRLWPVAAEAAASFAWVLGGLVALLCFVTILLTGAPDGALTAALAWGIAVALIATLQLCVAVALELRLDRGVAMTLLVGPLYPAAYWGLNACAALRATTPALLRPRPRERAVWDLPREHQPKLPARRRISGTLRAKGPRRGS